MSENERIDYIVESFIVCNGECENCVAYQKLDGINICKLLYSYRSRLLDAVTKIIEKM